MFFGIRINVVFYHRPVKRSRASIRYVRRKTADRLAAERRPLNFRFDQDHATDQPVGKAVIKLQRGNESSGGRPMGGFSDNRYTCLDCESEYSRPMAFI
ncbi:MAG: hypothetical protein OXG11_02210, partial [Chloroflexi bacterium]|nr:hypothetical protein [Chloroflexota bacterium]